MRRLLRAAALLAPSLAALALAGCGSSSFDASSQVGPDPKLPEAKQYLVPPMDVSPVVPWGSAMPSAGAGLKVSALASGFAHPRTLYVLPNGDVLVVESNGPGTTVFRPKELIMGKVKAIAGASAKGGNRITLLRDTNGDGKPDVRTVFIDHLNSPYGVALVGGDLYVANTDAVLRFPYVAGETRITAPGVRSNSNITENGMDAERDRAAVWEIDRATGAHRIYASGLRNPTNLDVQPGSGQLWAVVNERDELGPDLVPDYMTSVKDGAFYSWPYSYWGQHVDPRVMPQRPDLVARAIKPDYGLGSHVAALGIAFARGDGLPPAYRGGAFVGEHGSWDRSPQSGYKVVYVPFAGAQPSGKPVEVLTGFLDGQGHVRGRPVGLAIDKGGALLVADDVGNTVWRVTAR
jgi:glucose/arabinose dehydrogenase